MVNIGLDFGSTTTTVSVYNEKFERPEAVKTCGDTVRIPSIVAYDLEEKNYIIGDRAKSVVDDSDYIFYKGFKMLLVEENQTILKSRNYTKEITPKVIAKIFIKQIFENALKDLNEEEIGKLTIGVPEIWKNEISTVDGVAVIREIFKELELVSDDRLQIVSEPEAATAYIAVDENNPFSGHVLLIDYGGGTLDITLTEVSTIKDGSSHNMQIKSLERTGAGENFDGNIGLAGIRYMEEVMFETIREAELTNCSKIADFDDDEYREFSKSVYDLEREIISSKVEIENFFNNYESVGLYSLRNDMKEKFTKINYNGNKLQVTYYTLLKVYNNIFRNVLKEQLDKITSFMDSEGIDYSQKNQENFRIALVGGFGTYCLVNEQVKQYFKIPSQDRIMSTRADCEQAISLGTALFASNVVELKNTAPYSIGLYSYSEEKKKRIPNFAFTYRQDIEFDHIYFVKSARTNAVAIMSCASGGFGKLAINFGRDIKTTRPYKLKKEYENKLQNIITNECREANIGFSLSQHGVLSIYVFDFDRFATGEKRSKEYKKIELATLKDMFEDVVLN